MLLRRFLVLIAALLLLDDSAALDPCNSTANCGAGLACRDGVCRNLFESGCLAQLLPGRHKTKTRVCNADDPPQAAALGICRKPAFGYPELRITGEAWESIVFSAWLAQIILSEILDVPTSIEAWTPHTNLNFYDPAAAHVYGSYFSWDGFKNAMSVGGECALMSRDGTTADDYRPCSVANLESWNPDNIKGENLEYSTAPYGLGAVGQEAWFLPNFVAERDPTLSTYLGLKGEDNRKKLAETFLWPTSWKDYCDIVSPDNCTTADEFAGRAPVTEAEEGRYYYAESSSEIVYRGHFRKTSENDCEENPTTCRGHFTDYPCGWAINPSMQQIYHLEMALNNQHYSYGELTDIWMAANETKSNVMIKFWTPEPLVQKFQGTDAEFHKVAFPTATLECIQAWSTESCSDNFTAVVGSPTGVCDQPPSILSKFFSPALFDLTYDSSISDAERSPGWDALLLFRLTSLQMADIIQYTLRGDSPRGAVCQWAADNIEHLEKSMIPPSYPRVLVEDDLEGPLAFTAVVLSAVAFLMALLTMVAVYCRRKTRNIVYAQLEFLWLLLAGLLILAVGAFVVAIPPTNASCVATVWLVNLGYTLELVPLIVKVYAINTLIGSAKKMKRLELDRRALFGAVLAISSIVVLFLILWTVLDPPSKKGEYDISESETDAGEREVVVKYYCSSDNDSWGYISVSWNAALLLCATALTVQMRNIRFQGFNESRTLAMLIYSHFVFVVLRLVLFFLADELGRADVALYNSLIFSADIIASIFIYFLPMFFGDESESSMGSSALRVSGLLERPSSELELNSLRARITLLESRLIEEGANLEEEGLIHSETVKFNPDGQDTRQESAELQTSENRPESAVSERPESAVSEAQSNK